MARSVDPEGLRTMGVLTKVDIMDQVIPPSLLFPSRLFLSIVTTVFRYFFSHYRTSLFLLFFFLFSSIITAFLRYFTSTLLLVCFFRLFSLLLFLSLDSYRSSLSISLYFHSILHCSAYHSSLILLQFFFSALTFSPHFFSFLLLLVSFSSLSPIFRECQMYVRHIVMIH